MIIIGVTSAVVFHVDFFVGIVVFRQFGGVNFFADKDEIRFFYGGGAVQIYGVQTGIFVFILVPSGLTGSKKPKEQKEVRNYFTALFA